MKRIIRLSRSFASRYGVPVIDEISSVMFRRRYFTHCMQCGFCNDWCCRHGVDVDVTHAEAMGAYAADLEAFTRVNRADWFSDEFEEDDSAPGGGSYRTNVRDGACVFLNRAGRGCLIHEFCLERGIDYHQLKSLVDCLFPLTYEGSLLTVADEVDDDSLVCLDVGPTVYRGLRSELGHYFGEALVKEFDELEEVAA